MRADIALGEIEDKLAGADLQREVLLAALAAQGPYSPVRHRRGQYTRLNIFARNFSVKRMLKAAAGAIQAKTGGWEEGNRRKK
jgi:hypothetical protein